MTVEAGIADDVVVHGGCVSDVVVRAKSGANKSWRVGEMITHFKELVVDVLAEVSRRIGDGRGQRVVEAMAQDAVDTERG